MGKVKELQKELTDISNKIDELTTRKHELNRELDKLLVGYQDFHVGDKVITNLGEYGEVVSIDGPVNSPVLVVVHRTDVHCDDMGMFGQNGKSYGSDNKYTIEKL